MNMQRYEYVVDVQTEEEICILCACGGFQDSSGTFSYACSILFTRDCIGDGVTSDGGYGDITGDKIFTGEVTG